jgi:hypothetical protein
MKTLRLLPLAAFSLAFGLMTSCDSTTSSNSGPSIQEARLDNTTLNPGGGKVSIRAVASDDNGGMSVAFVVKNSSGTDVTTNFTISYTAALSSAKTWHIGSPDEGDATIAAKSSAAAGSYTLYINLTDASGGIASQPVTFTVSGTVVTGTPLSEVASYDDGSAIVAGAQGNANASFLSIQDLTTYTSGTITDWGVIDLIYFADASSNVYLYSPAQAKTEGLGSLPSSGLNNTQIYSTSSTYASFTTAEQVTAALASATGTGTKAAATSGGVYLFKLVTGQVGVLSITSLNGTGRTSSISIKWASN